MKITKFVLFGLVVMGLASCSQDVELGEFQEETAELISGHLKVKIMDAENANTRRRIHLGDRETLWGSTIVQHYHFDINDAIGIYCPDAQPGHQRGLYNVDKTLVTETEDGEIIETETATSTLTKIEGGINYYNSKVNDPHRIFAGIPSNLVKVTQAYDYNESLGYESCGFEANIPSKVTCSISENAGEDGYYTAADWNSAIFAGGEAIAPIALLSSRPGFSGGDITLFPMFTALELDMEIPQDGLKISKISIKGQVWKEEGNQAVDVNLVGACTGRLNSSFIDYYLEDFIPQGEASDNQTMEMTITGDKKLNSGDKLRSTFFFFPCGTSENGFFAKGSQVPFKIQVIVEYTVGDSSETQYAKATFKPTIELAGHNNINLGKIGGNGTASTKKLTFS